MEAVERALAERFHLAEFRPLQREVIDAVLGRQDALVVMPTGGGKSLCYQLPALLLPGVTLIVSPLIALMKDQVDRMNALGIPALAMNSTLAYAQQRNLMQRLRSGEIKALFTSPERLESTTFREELSSLSISLIAVDEAHCISEWGHDFRTAYRRLPGFFDIFEERPPIIALTATATPEVRTDIAQLLKLREPFGAITGFERPNIAYGVLRESDKNARLLDILRSIGDAPAIVYGSTRRSVEQITVVLKHAGIAVESYHAGVPLGLRKSTQERYLAGHARVIVATSAFGMGIDKADIRAVIHYDVPGSLEAYYQESGRAGRDGRMAHAVLLLNQRDIETQRFLIRANSPIEEEIKSVYNALHEIAGNAVGSSIDSIVAIDPKAILERIPKPLASFERIIEVLERAGHVRHHRSHGNDGRSRLQFLVSRRRAEEILFKSSNAAVKKTLDALMRSVSSEAYESEVLLDANKVLERFSLDAEDLKTATRTLEGLGILRYSAPTRASSNSGVFYISFPSGRLALQHLDVDSKSIRARYEANMSKLDRMLRYGVEWSCRRNAILEYFGEHPRSTTCGMCDVCVAKTRD